MKVKAVNENMSLECHQLLISDLFDIQIMFFFSLQFYQWWNVDWQMCGKCGRCVRRKHVGKVLLSCYFLFTSICALARARYSLPTPPSILSPHTRTHYRQKQTHTQTRNNKTPFIFILDLTWTIPGKCGTIQGLFSSYVCYKVSA